MGFARSPPLDYAVTAHTGKALALYTADADAAAAPIMQQAAG